jgi:hypothetical protein
MEAAAETVASGRRLVGVIIRRSAGEFASGREEQVAAEQIGARVQQQSNDHSADEFGPTAHAFTLL